LQRVKTAITKLGYLHLLLETEAVSEVLFEKTQDDRQCQTYQVYLWGQKIILSIWTIFKWNFNMQHTFRTPSHTFFSLLTRKICCEHLTITIHTSEVSLVVMVQNQHHNDKPLYFEALTNPVINSLFPPLFAFPEFHTLSSQGSAMLSFLS